MRKLDPLQWISLIMAIGVIAVLILRTTGLITWQTFWYLLILAAAFAYLILPRLRKK